MEEAAKAEAQVKKEQKSSLKRGWEEGDEGN